MSSNTHVRDPLYGYIELSDSERTVLDQPQVQRLRRVRQLGFSSLIYPGATHTRFEHSLGVMHLAGQFAKSLDMDDSYVAEVRMAGLLHDTGHGPFSHASELLLDGEGKTHESISCEIVDELSDVLPAAPERVKAHITGDADVNIVAGTIDADRMDYLRRDSASTGIEHGTIDTPTIIQYADTEDGQLVFDEKSVQALEGLLTARAHMIKSVYYHHASTIAETMLLRALEDFVDREGVPPQELMRFDDYEMHNHLLGSSGDARWFYERLADRELYKRSITLGEDALPRSALRYLEETVDAHEVETAIAEEAGLDTRYVLVNAPKTPSNDSLEALIRMDDGTLHPIADVSAIPTALREVEWRAASLDVYAPPEHVEAVRDAAKPVVQSLVG